jgi:hypothetical protein
MPPRNRHDRLLEVVVQTEEEENSNCKQSELHGRTLPLKSPAVDAAAAVVAVTPRHGAAFVGGGRMLLGLTLVPLSDG